MRLSVVIPIYNEIKTIEEIIRRVQDCIMDKEIILVDDCSTDGTRGLLKKYETQDNIRVIYQSHNQGKGAALRAGFQAVRGEIIVVQDGVSPNTIHESGGISGAYGLRLENGVAPVVSNLVVDRPDPQTFGFNIGGSTAGQLNVSGRTYKYMTIL